MSVVLVGSRLEDEEAESAAGSSMPVTTESGVGTGSGRPGTGRAGTGRPGTGRAGTGRAGIGRAGTGTGGEGTPGNVSKLA